MVLNLIMVALQNMVTHMIMGRPIMDMMRRNNPLHKLMDRHTAMRRMGTKITDTKIMDTRLTHIKDLSITMIKPRSFAALTVLTVAKRINMVHWAPSPMI